MSEMSRCSVWLRGKPDAQQHVEKRGDTEQIAIFGTICSHYIVHSGFKGPTLVCAALVRGYTEHKHSSPHINRLMIPTQGRL